MANEYSDVLEKVLTKDILSTNYKETVTLHWYLGAGPHLCGVVIMTRGRVKHFRSAESITCQNDHVGPSWG